MGGPSAEVGSAYAYPVPFVAAREQNINFANLPDEGEIRIYTAATGELVKTITIDAGHPDLFHGRMAGIDCDYFVFVAAFRPQIRKVDVSSRRANKHQLCEFTGRRRNSNLYPLRPEQLVKTITIDAGHPDPLPWNATNDSGQALGSDVYTYQIKAGGNTKTGKLVIVR